MWLLIQCMNVSLSSILASDGFYELNSAIIVCKSSYCIEHFVLSIPSQFVMYIIPMLFLMLWSNLSHSKQRFPWSRMKRKSSYNMQYTTYIVFANILKQNKKTSFPHTQFSKFLLCQIVSFVSIICNDIFFGFFWVLIQWLWIWETPCQR